MHTAAPEPAQLDTATARALAVEAAVDPRSIIREHRRPGSVRGMAGHRARSALAARGLVPVAAPPPREEQH